MSTKNIAYCGDNCAYCPKYSANLIGGKKKKREVALVMKKVSWRYNLDEPERMRCEGCQDVEICEYGIKECCIEKKVENCGKCVDYPCPTIEKAFEITEKNVERFKKILSSEDYEIFRKAYFLKKENLEKERV